MVDIRIFFVSFHSCWYKMEQKLFLGVFEVAEHEYDIGLGPGIIGAQDGGYVHLSGVFIQLGI